MRLGATTKAILHSIDEKMCKKKSLSMLAERIKQKKPKYPVSVLQKNKAPPVLWTVPRVK